MTYDRRERIPLDEYKALPPKLVGLTKTKALGLLARPGCIFGIAREDGSNNILPAVVQILLNIEKGVVIGTELDGKSYGRW